MRLIRKFLRKHSKILVFASVGFAVLALALSAVGARPVYAQGLGDGPVPPPTPPGLFGAGLSRYLAILAIASIPDSAQCDTGAGSAAAGYLGKNFNLGNDVSGHYNPYGTWDGTPGANGPKTGENNSGVCGNRP